MKKINLAFITDRMIKGHGVDLVVDRLADGLAKIGYDCKVYCNYFDETFINRKSYDIEKLHYFRPDINPITYEQRIRKLAPYLNSRDVDLFIIQSFPFYSLVPVLNKPTLVVTHGVPSVSGMPLKRRLRFKYMQLSEDFSYFKKADRVVTVSKYLLDCLSPRIKDKATFIYNGCDHYKQGVISKNRINEFRKGIDVRSDDVLLLFVGRLNLTNQPYKGLAELIHIYHSLRKKRYKVKLMTVGYGSTNDEIFLKNQGIKAISNAPEDLMPLIYKSCDIYTTCSHWEGFDLPVAEAQSFGKPTVCYNICAHPEVSVDGGTGFVVDTQQEFIDKLEMLIKDSKIREEMGENGYQYSKRFLWKNSVDNYDKIIQDIIANKKPEKIHAGKVSGNRFENLKDGRVTAIIVNYNSSYDCLKDCLDSLKKQTYKKLDILIYDNGSDNSVVEEIKDDYSNLRIMRSSKNIGLGKALNEAMYEVDSEFILISNFDVVYEHDSIEIMVHEMKKLDRIYLGLAPKIKFYYEKEHLESTGIYLDHSMYIGYHGIGQLDLDQYNRQEDIFGVSFTSAFLRREAFFNSKIGPIDPTFFLYYEDVDFCYRANIQGYKFRSCPTACCYHKYAYSFRNEAVAFTIQYYYQKSSLLKTIYKNSDDGSMKRRLGIEMAIQKQNLKDANMKQMAKNILREFRSSIRDLKRKRNEIQFSRQVIDTEILKYSWREKNFFNFVSNEPIFCIENLYHTYRRLFVMIGNPRYSELANYLNNLENTRYNIDSRIFKKILHSKFEYEPVSVHQFIDRIY